MRSFFLLLAGILFVAQANADSLTFVFNDDPYIRIHTQPDMKNNSVAWNEYSAVYYIVGTDSTHTFVAVADADGTILQQVSFSLAVKGLWYNSALAFPEAYIPDENTCVSFFTNEFGMFENEDFLIRLEELQENKKPTYMIYNSVYDMYAYTEPIAGLVIELSSYTGEIYNYLNLELPVSQDKIHFEQLLYTGSDKMPYALVNEADKELYCFDIEGKLVMRFSLPTTYFQPKYYSFVNGLLWLYNEAEGEWTGHGFVIR